VSDGRAQLRVYAQIGDSPLLYELADVEIDSHDDVPAVLRTIADEYAEKWPELPRAQPS
jgi:hypothetical protein